MTKPDFNWDALPVLEDSTANPAAGSDLADITVPTGKRWLYLGGYCSLVNDANVANRYMTVTVKVGGTNTHATFINNTAMTANGTYYITEATIGNNVSTGGREVIGIGPCELPAGSKISHALLNKQAGDDLTAFNFRYKEAPA